MARARTVTEAGERDTTPTHGTHPGRRAVAPARVGAPASDEDARLLAALRAGDEAAFADLVDRYHGRLVRLATVYVRDRGLAEEVAQEAWLGVLRGLDGYEGRSSLRVWIFGILTN
jgi:RNA polymerase sigma-70 factor, ECF subfamily